MAKYGVGQPVRRTEDPRLLTGRGKFNDDYTIDNAAHGFVLRSPHAHADIISIDAAAAQSAPGVLGVYTGADLTADDIGGFPGPPPFFAELTKPDGSPLSYPPQFALTSDRARYVGDPVAFVVAETLDQARDAADLIDVTYDPLPVVTDTAAAMSPGAPQIWDEVPENFLFQARIGNQETTDAAFENAAHVAHVSLVNNRIVQNSMEVRGAIGSYDADSGRYTLYTSNQNRHMLRDWIANSFLKCDPQSLRVLVDDVGGGFGMKTHAYHEQVLVLYAAKKLGRGVRWISDRTEAFLSDLHGRDHISECDLALDADGKFLAVRVHQLIGVDALGQMGNLAHLQARRMVRVLGFAAHGDRPPSFGSMFAKSLRTVHPCEPVGNVRARRGSRVVGLERVVAFDLGHFLLHEVGPLFLGQVIAFRDCRDATLGDDTPPFDFLIRCGANGDFQHVA